MLKNSSFGDRIKAERRRLGLSQEDLAEKLGVSRSSVAYYEAARTVPDLDFLVHADDAGMDVFYIVFGRHSSEQAGLALDWDLLASILQGIRGWCTNAGLTMPVEKEVAIAKLLYSQFAKAKLVDAELMKQVLKLAA